MPQKPNTLHTSSLLSLALFGLANCSSSDSIASAQASAEAERATYDYVFREISQRCVQEGFAVNEPDFERCFEIQANRLRAQLESMAPGPAVECAAATACNGRSEPELGKIERDEWLRNAGLTNLD